MCGISGAVGRLSASLDDLPTDRRAQRIRVVEAISGAQGHRGPDGAGLWTAPGGDVVFAHRRLAILDLSEAGAQPMVDRGSGCAITFNGEIYNYVPLRGELEALGERFTSSSDTEVILRAYTRWGLDAIPKFRGIFAMALWDPRARAVHLVRDPLGIKPLYWTIVREGTSGEEVLLFASEVRALLASDVVARHLDPEAVASYLYHGFVVGPSTIVEGVHLLPAASTLTLLPGDRNDPKNRRATTRYWTMPSSNIRRTTVEELQAELEATVRMQLVADVPVGVFLSGGIDSSAVAAVATQVAPAVHTFTIGFAESGFDESDHAARVAKAIGSHHTSVRLREEDFLEHLGDAFTAIDQPTFDGINTYFVSRAAREAGMTVALAGTGGDELFGGYRSFVDIPKALSAGSWLSDNAAVQRALGGSIGGAARLVNTMFWDIMGHAPPQTRWGKLADVARAAHDALALYQVSYALFTRETQARMASGRVQEAQRRAPYGIPSEVAQDWRARIDGSETLHAISLLEMASFIGERLLRDTDSASMAVALEVRVPLLDHVLYEKVTGVDPRRRFQPLGKKQLLRDIALARLDPAIFDRPKSGFVLPIDNWARQGLQQRMETLFSDHSLVERVGLRPEAVKTLWKSFAARRPGLYWSRIWAIFVLLWWSDKHQMRLMA